MQTINTISIPEQTNFVCDCCGKTKIVNEVFTLPLRGWFIINCVFTAYFNDSLKSFEFENYLVCPDCSKKTFLEVVNAAHNLHERNGIVKEVENVLLINENNFIDKNIVSHCPFCGTNEGEYKKVELKSGKKVNVCISCAAKAEDWNMLKDALEKKSVH